MKYIIKIEAKSFKRERESSPDFHRWRPCQATNLTTAKEEAIRVLGPSARNDDRLVIALDRGKGNYYEVATKVGNCWFYRPPFPLGRSLGR
jgi:hypothetical protein